MKESNRRNFLRRIVTLTASAGVAGLLLDRLPGKSVIQPVQATSGGGPGGDLVIDSSLNNSPPTTANTGTGTTELDTPGNPGFLVASTGSGAALQGTCTAGTGVLGTTTTGWGVQGVAGTATSGSGATALAGFAGNPGAIPIVAQGDTGQTANLQEWRGSSGALSVVTASGSLGIGTNAPNYPLQINTIYSYGLYLNALYGAAGIAVNAPSGSASTFDWQTAGTLEWRLLKQTDNSLLIVNAGGTPVIAMYQTGTVALAPYSGNVGIGTTTPSHLIQLAGGAYSDGSTWNNSSSVRWKENIDPLTDGVTFLKQLHPVSYNYRKAPAKRTMGFIAEEIGKVLPTIVDWDKAELGYAEGYDHVAILALAVQALKELAERNSEQQSTIEVMKEQQDQFKNENEKLLERIVILERAVKQFAAS